MGKVFLFSLGDKWADMVDRKEATINITMEGGGEQWLNYSVDTRRFIGVPLASHRNKAATVFLNTRNDVHAFQVLVEKPINYLDNDDDYQLVMRFGVHGEMMLATAPGYIAAFFVVKLVRFLPHVSADEVRVYTCEDISTDEEVTRYEIRWSVDKFTSKVFLRHYYHLLTDDSTSLRATSNINAAFFFAMLPQFVLEQLGMRLSDDDSLLAADTKSATTAATTETATLAATTMLQRTTDFVFAQAGKVVGDSSSLSSGDSLLVSVISVVIPAFLLTFLVFMFLYRRLKKRWSLSELRDRTFDLRRKPAILQEEIEMDMFGPAKVVILPGDCRQQDDATSSGAHEPRIFQLSIDHESDDDVALVINDDVGRSRHCREANKDYSYEEEDGSFHHFEAFSFASSEDVERAEGCPSTSLSSSHSHSSYAQLKLVRE